MSRSFYCLRIAETKPALYVDDISPLEGVTTKYSQWDCRLTWDFPFRPWLLVLVFRHCLSHPDWRNIEVTRVALADYCEKVHKALGYDECEASA